MAKKRKKLKISDQIRSAIESSGVSQYEIWKATGVSKTSLSRFTRGQRVLSLDAVDALAEYFGWKLDLGKQKKPKRKQ